MLQVKDARFACEGCGKTYRWKPELAGRRVKCACGAVMTCPYKPQPAFVDDLYDVVSDDDAPMPRGTATATGSFRKNPFPKSPPLAKRAPLEYRKPREEPDTISKYFPDR